MPEYNTSALKLFAQTTRAKLVSLIGTKVRYLLNTDDIASKTYKTQIDSLRKALENKTEKVVVEEVAYTWFNRIMALRFMDANGYNSPMVVSYAEGQTRPEILQEALAGNIDPDLDVSGAEIMLEEKDLYRRLLVASCNHLNGSMPFLFERITDYTELLLPDDLLSQQSFVTDIRNGMSDADCENVELMGWLYQFYIIDRKKEAEGNKKRSGGLKSDEQAAATQLFTPHWVVRYMVENSLGRIWMTLHPDSNLVNEMPYYIKPTEDQVDVLPDGIHSAADIRFIDPCMGSGHILVYAFDLFVKMYEEEGKISRDIPALIIQNNLFGIDIDPRCYQLACFAITMKARAYYSRYLRNTVQPNVIALRTIDEDVIRSTGKWSANSLMWQFTDVDTIGSLLKIAHSDFERIQVGEGLFAEQQRLLKKQAEYLSREYHCVVTNPPYLGKGMGEALKAYVSERYPSTKGDMMANFMERCLEYCSNFGKVGMINQDSWMFMVTYEDYRKKLLNSPIHIDSLIHLGPHAFAEIGGEMVKSTTFVIGKHESLNKSIFISVYGYKKHFEKERYALEAIKESSCDWKYCVRQSAFRQINGCPICFWGKDEIYEIYANNESVSSLAYPCVGLQTANNELFLRTWFEVSLSDFNCSATDALSAKSSRKKWFPYNKGGYTRRWYGNQELVVNWENDGSDIKAYKGSAVRNPSYYFKPCVSWGLITGPVFRFYPKGFIFDVAGMSCFFDENDEVLENDENNETEHLKAYQSMAWLNSCVFAEASKLISPAGKLQVGEFARMPAVSFFPNDSVKKVQECISIAKQDWDAHETSWNFKENELVRVCREYFNENMEQGVLLQSVLESYKKEWLDKLNTLRYDEEFFNREYIEHFGLQDEMDCVVPLQNITILQKGEISVENGKVVWHDDVILRQLISYFVGCVMGRYSIEKKGLIIASQGQSVSDLDFSPSSINVDDDGIVPIVQEEDVFADDMTQRIELAIRNVFGKKYFGDNIAFIEKTLNAKLRSYFYKSFFEDHQQIYSVKGFNSPIYWQFSSSMGEKNRKGCFKALVYMHRIDGDTLSRLHADYVRPYLNRLELQYKELQEQSLRDDLSAKQKTQLLNRISEMQSMILEISAYEKRLIEMASARMTIDLDDGVRVNYPKFYPLVEYIKGLDEEDEE